MLSQLGYGQKTDTLTFYSKAFKQERTVYIQTPAFFNYCSDSVKLPVIYLLDGQNEWFAKPAISSINYLNYTKEIPQAIVVIIPLIDRVNECEITALEGQPLPLHRFITTELPAKIKNYKPSDYQIIIGHSFSASFALYSFLLNPEKYTAVLANSPLDQLELLIETFEENKEIDLSKIYLSIGGAAPGKDSYHRAEYDKLKLTYPHFFNKIHSLELDFSAHTAVPIIGIPMMLTTLFTPYSSRYDSIALVDMNYKLLKKPQAVEYEMALIKNASKIHNYPYPPEIADINGIASRYSNSEYTQHAMAVYELGIRLYPNYYEFHHALGELYLPSDKEKSKWHLNKALKLLNTTEMEMSEKEAVFGEIMDMKIKNGL